MLHSRTWLAIALLGLAGCSLVIKPQGDGPQWIERGASDLVEANGKPDRVVRLPLPSLSTAYLYLGGAEPGFAICERDYFIRGATVVGYSEHGSAPGCTRRAGNTE